MKNEEMMGTVQTDEVTADRVINDAWDESKMQIADFESMVERYGLRHVATAGAARFGLTQREIAERVGVASGTLYRHFQSRQPSPRTVARYFNAFGNLKKKPQNDERQLDSGAGEQDLRLKLDSLLLKFGFESVESTDSNIYELIYRRTKPQSHFKMQELFEMIGEYRCVCLTTLAFTVSKEVIVTIGLRSPLRSSSET
jgi:transcriptional regulator with XRE-family HTH domain